MQLLSTIVLFVCLSGFTFSLNAAEIVSGISARRAPGVSAQSKMHEFETTHANRFPSRKHDEKDGKAEKKRDRKDYLSAYEARVLLEKLDTSSVPEVSKEDMLTIFTEGRDHRPLVDQESRKRRPTWLYPDDGCFARAELVNREAEKRGHTVPLKVFVFGNLSAETTNHPDGMISWWYHVAPILKNDGEVYVLDPALKATEPLTLKDWVGRMSDEKAEVSVCVGTAYDPGSLCFKDEGGTASRAIADESYYLESEWERIEDLGRNPEDELGDRPPWSIEI